MLYIYHKEIAKKGVTFELLWQNIKMLIQMVMDYHEFKILL